MFLLKKFDSNPQVLEVSPCLFAARSVGNYFHECVFHRVSQLLRIIQEP